VKKTFLLLALVLFGSAGVFAQGSIEPPLPDPHKTTEWTFLHIHDTERPYEGVNRGFGVTADKEAVNMPEFSDIDIYAAKFETYLKDNGQVFEQRKIKRVRFILDSENNLTREQREMLTAVAKANGYKIKFEVMKIDWEGRYRKLVKEGADNIEELIPDYVLEKLNKKQRAEEVKRARSGFLSWTKKYYEKPTRRDVSFGTTKGVITLGLTMAAWKLGGMQVTDAVFWVLTAEHVLIETFFGPYQRTYMNFLYNKVKDVSGNIGMNAWGMFLGFTMMSIDAAIIFWSGVCEKALAPWDPIYLAGYFGMTFIGSLLGGFMPVGIYKLIQKGWMTKDVSINTMVGLDMLMPVEGVLLSMKSPYLQQIFIIHQAVKFGIFILGNNVAKSKNSLVMIPKDIYDSKELQGIFEYRKIPDSRAIKIPERTREFLESNDTPRQVKVAFAKYIKRLLKDEKGLIEANPEFKQIVTDIVAVLVGYTDKVGANEFVEFEKLRPYSKTSNIFLNDPEDLKSGYRTGFLGKGFWKNADYIYSRKGESKRLKREMTTARYILAEIFDMPLADYKFDFDQETVARLEKFKMITALSEMGTKYDLTQSENVSFEKWFEKVSTKDKVENPYEFNKILFDYDLLGWMYRQNDNDKKNSQVEYLLGQVTKYSTAELTPSQKTKYEDWKISYEAESDYAQQGVANYLQRASEYLGVEYSKLKWNKDVKEDLMTEVLETVIEKYEKLGKEEIRLLFVGDAENKPVAEYFLEKANSGDAYAQYKISILGLVLAHNVSRMKFSYEPLYKDFIDRASMFMLKIENDERIDKLEKTRRDILEGKFRFVK
jgi:hypothetical protein